MPDLCYLDSNTKGVTVFCLELIHVHVYSTPIPANQSTVFNPSAFSNIKKQVDCDFDSGDTCNWYKSTDQPLLFNLHSGETPSGGTGPDFDHTKGQGSNGRYLYLESSAPSKVNETAVLVSPDLLPANNDPVCFSFWYHMMGTGVGTLHVTQIHTSNTTLFSKAGNQADTWQHAKVTVTPPGPVSIVIQASVGDSYLGDIAVDDFNLTDGKCKWCFYTVSC